MTRYFFGYVSNAGNIYPVRWVEEDGEVIGGKIMVVQRHELVMPSYFSCSLETLTRIFPYIPPVDLT